MIGRLSILFLLGCFFTGSASAHTRSESHSNWQITSKTVRLSFTVPDTEARRLGPGGTALPSPAALAAYLARHVGVASGTSPCQLLGTPEPVQSVPGVQRVEFTFECPSARGIRVSSSAFFEMVPTHTNFVQVQTDNGDFIEQLITADSQTVDVEQGSGGELRQASFFKYIELGMMHIFTGVDHQSFLLGLILLSRRFRDLAFVITGFTLGHSCTLALAVTGILRPHAEYIDALIGLTIALVGAESLGQSTGRPTGVALATGGMLLLAACAQWAGFGGLPALLLLGSALFATNYLMVAGHIRDAARLRLVVTLVFGFIHGFGFAADLLDMRLPTGRLAELLVGFNLGVEIGQLTLVAGLLMVVALLVRFKLALPRALVSEVGSAFLIGIGLYWLVSRSYA